MLQASCCCLHQRSDQRRSHHALTGLSWIADTCYPSVKTIRPETTRPSCAASQASREWRRCANQPAAKQRSITCIAMDIYSRAVLQAMVNQSPGHAPDSSPHRILTGHPIEGLRKNIGITCHMYRSGPPHQGMFPLRAVSNVRTFKAGCLSGGRAADFRRDGLVVQR